MNKAFVINQEGNVTFIPCKDNAEAIQVYDAIKARHADQQAVYSQSNVTLILTDGSLISSKVYIVAKPEVYLPKVDMH